MKVVLLWSARLTRMCREASRGRWAGGGGEAKQPPH